MPLTDKGKKIARSMKDQYGEGWKKVFYASKNAGTIKGVEKKKDKKSRRKGKKS